MIVQITLIRNEKYLLKELLPVWKRYADGFVFLVDTSDDGTEEYLREVADQYNILEIIVQQRKEDELWVASEVRQTMFDAAKKYTNKIVCLDADEYFDGSLTKEQLNEALDSSEDLLLNLKWIQYTSANTIRVDGPWKNNYKGRIGVFNSEYKFRYDTMHATHLPIPEKQITVSEEVLFIAHLQWLDRNIVGIKQYCYKIEDYANAKKFAANVVDKEAYDASINDFNWEEEYYDYPLRIREDIYEHIINSHYYRMGIVKEKTKEFDIPNLGDWGLNIHDSIPMYFCTAADEKHYHLLINLIGSIHKHNFYDVVEIRVYDIGLNDAQKRELKNIKRVRLCEIERTNDRILEYIKTSETKLSRGAFSWKPVVIKDALDNQPYTLYLDAGTTILKPLNHLFKHILENGYLFFDCGHSIKWMTTKYVINSQNLMSEENRWILDDDVFGIDAGFQGVSRSIYQDYVLPMYNLTRDINNFIDDKTCPNGFGCGRQDQTLYSIFARKLRYDVISSKNDYEASSLRFEGKKVQFHITHTRKDIKSNTVIYRSRWDLDYQSYKVNSSSIKREYIISAITAIGSLDKYESFVPTYFNNITQQINFKRIEFIIVYSQWSKHFDAFKSYENIKFIKEDQSLGVYNAWNIGIKNATAEYITNWNVDDIRFPINNKLKYDLLHKDSSIDLAYNLYVGIDESKLTEDFNLSDGQIQRYPDDYHLYATVACMAGPDPMWRKSFHTFGGFFDNENYNVIGDWEMWIRMASMGLRFKLIPHATCIYIDHNNTVSKLNQERSKEQQRRLQKQYNINNSALS